MPFFKIPYNFLESFQERACPPYFKKKSMWSDYSNTATTPGGRFGHPYRAAAGFAPIVDYATNGFGDGVSFVPGISGIGGQLAFGAALRHHEDEFGLGPWGFSPILITSPVITFPEPSVFFQPRADGRLEFLFGVNRITSSDPLVTLRENTWYYIECEILYFESTDPDTTHKLTVSAWIEGQIVIDHYLYDTGFKPADFPYIRPASLQAPTVWDFTDMYVRLGAAFGTGAKVLALRPNAEGTHTEWPHINPDSPTTHFSKVDEILLDIDELNPSYIATNDGEQAQDATVIDTFLLDHISNPFSMTDALVYAAQMSYYADGTVESDENGGHFGTVHVVNDQECKKVAGPDQVLDPGVLGLYDLAYVETIPGTSDPIHISDINAFDAGVECTFIPGFEV